MILVYSTRTLQDLPNIPASEVELLAVDSEPIVLHFDERVRQAIVNSRPVARAYIHILGKFIISIPAEKLPRLGAQPVVVREQ